MSSAKIKKVLKDGDLSKAFDLLGKRTNDIGNYDLKSIHEDLLSTYRTVLTYLLQGYSDKDCTKFHQEIIRTLFCLNDRTDRMERIITTDKSSRYVLTYKSVQTASLENIMQRLSVELPPEEHEEETCLLFNQVWTSDIWKKGVYETATQLLTSDDISDTDKAVFISAVTLALFEMFDVRKLHLLFDAYLSPVGIISQRALCGIIIIVRMYDSRLECFPEIQERLKEYAEDERFVKEMFSALLQFQFSCLTDKISSKVRNELCPMIMKNHDGLRKMSKEELREKLTANGENPDWVEEQMEKSIQEIGEMQLEGADVYMSSFRFMKGYTYFNKLPHWFYPFKWDSYLITDPTTEWSDTMSKFFKTASNRGLFCNSDLYSFYFMIKSWTGSDKHIMDDTLTDKYSVEELEAFYADSENETQTHKTIRRNYIFDLYRFCYCYPFSNQFDNPFKVRRKNADGTERIQTFSPLETKSFSFLLSNRAEMETLAEFFMRKEYYEEALEMYRIIDPKEIEEDANLWQKIGFCRQKLGKEKAAYKNYLLADSLLPDSRWTMAHIAQLAQKLEIYDTAIDYYDMLLQQDPENLKFIVNKAVCQMKSRQFEDAITTLYKAHYLDEESVNVRSMMVECYILTGQKEKAAEQIATIITSEKCPVGIRILNAFLTLKDKSFESAYYCIREAESFFSVQPNDGHSFSYYYNEAIGKFAASLDIEPGIARMLLDAVNLDIR